MKLQWIKPLYWLIFVAHALLWNTVQKYKVYILKCLENLSLPVFGSMNQNALLS